MSEQSRARNLLYRTLMTVSHRKYDDLVAAFHEGLESDPDFTSKACVYTTLNSKIRDQADSAVIALLQASPTYPEYREAGRCLLLGRTVYDVKPNRVPGLEPFRIFRIAKHIRESGKKSPRLMRSIMTDYLHRLEGDPMRFDGVAMRNRKALKDAYHTYHVKAGERALWLVSRADPPADSKMAVLKQVANSTDLREQIRLVVENRVPYTVATSVLPKMSPAVAIALIELMSPTEALNSRAWVERSGILGVPEVKDAYVAKIAKATKSVASAEHRVSAQGTDVAVSAAVERAKEIAVKRSKRIERKTLLMVDRSGSMEQAISIACEFGARIAPLCDDLMVVAFNDYAQEIKVRGPTLNDWKRSFRGIRAGGSTSMQAGLDLALKRGFLPEQIVIATDEGENRGSYAGALTRLASAGHESPHTIIINIGGHRLLSNRVESAGHRMDRFVYTGDYYIFDQIVPLLGGPKQETLIDTILSIELPHRKGWVLA